ncbi:Obp7 [Eciton burchellii]|nr:Obp7 [Eciton burchellii]
MKTILLAVLAVLAFVATLDGFKLTDEQRSKLKSYKESCIAETGIDPSVIDDAKHGQFHENDEKLGCFVTCMLKKIGIMDADGNVDWEVARSKLPPDVSQDDFDHVFDRCKDIAGDGCKKAANLLKCALEGSSPSHKLFLSDES